MTLPVSPEFGYALTVVVVMFTLERLLRRRKD